MSFIEVVALFLNLKYTWNEIENCQLIAETIISGKIHTQKLGNSGATLIHTPQMAENINKFLLKLDIHVKR